MSKSERPKRRKRIYCIEGMWDEARNPQTSVRPVLDYLSAQGYWPDFIYRYCTNYETLRECFAEFNTHCSYGSVLYLATHGDDGSLSFSETLEICVEQLGLMLWYGNCASCVVHFASCRTLSQDTSTFDAFLKNTGVTAVTGYSRDVGWLSRSAPGMVVDQRYLAGLSSADDNPAPNLRRWRGSDLENYSALCNRIQHEHGETGFIYHMRDAKS